MVANSSGNDNKGPTEMTSHKLNFPQDYRFHTNNNEWVYFSGIVETSTGKEFGLMYTIFQFSAGGGSYSYPTMLGISDPETARFYGSRSNWQSGTLGSTADGLPLIEAGDSAFRWNSSDDLYIASVLNASDLTAIAVEMNMQPTRDVLIHGQDGFIPMGDGIPSGYYSLTNLLPTNGALRIGDQQHTITGGRIWMDRQWGDWTGAGYAWDWFSLRFDDGGALMLFQFRDAYDAVVMGNWTYRDKEGLVTYGTDFKVDAKRMFRSYPIDWTVTLPSIDAEFKVRPLFDDQTFTGLWEGLCDVSGRVGTSQLTGHAFVELSSY
jgi:predicted secreted hydrolase